MVPMLLTSTATVPEQIVAQVPTVITFMIDVMTSLVSNPFFAMLFAFGFARIAMSLIKKAKKASR